MPAPYSYDLRSKAIQAVKRGERKIEVCRMLNISRNTWDLWLKREQETGDCRAIVNFQQGIDNREEYAYGYCKIGQRFHCLKLGKRTERVSWIAALKEGKLLAPMTFEGSCNRDLFEMWLSNCLVPQLQPGDVIVIDNATFHRSQYINNCKN